MKQVALLLLCLMLTIPVVAQQDTIKQVDREITLYGGLTKPYLPLEFRTFWKTGWHAGLGYGYSFTPGSFGYGAVSASVEYNRTTFDPTKYRDSLINRYAPLSRERGLLEAGKVTAGNASIFAASLNFKGSFSTSKHSIAPYFLVSLGYSHVSIDSIGVDSLANLGMSQVKSSTVSWSFGVGIEAPVTERILFFVEGKSSTPVLDPSRQYFPLSAGLVIRI